MASLVPTERIVICTVLTAASFTLGYIVARRPTVPIRKVQSVPPAALEVLDEPDDGDFTLINAGLLQACKLVLIVRTDTKLSAGKVSEFCGHATLACYKALKRHNTKLVQHWEYTGQAKIALKAKSEKQLADLENHAKSLNLCARSVRENPSDLKSERMVLAIGPAPVDVVNEVTGKLRLF